MESSCLDGNVIGSVERHLKCILCPESYVLKLQYVHPCLDQWITGSCCFCHLLHDRFLVSSLQWLHNWTQSCQKSLRCVVQILRNKDTIHKDLAELKKSTDIPNIPGHQTEITEKNPVMYQVSTPPSGRAALGRCQVEWSHPANFGSPFESTHFFPENCNTGVHSAPGCR